MVQSHRVNQIAHGLQRRLGGWRSWLVGLLLLGGFSAYFLWRSQLTRRPVESATESAAVTPVQSVTALGYLEPQGRVIQLSAPMSAGGTSRVEQLLVRQGERVKVGQVVAVLDSRQRLQAALREAEEQVRVAESNLAVVKAGAKAGEIAAQQAEITRLAAQQQGDIQAQAATLARLQAELANAQAEAQRYEILYQQGAASASLRDSKALTRDTAARSLQAAEAVLNRLQTTRSPELSAAQATLARIAEVRPVDISAAAAQVDLARAALQQAQAQLDLAAVRAPQAGTVLDIHTRPGELISSDGILELGQTGQMTALLEVYQTEIGKVKLGQPVKLFTDSGPVALSGQVSEIGVKVKRQNVVNSDTSANIDARIVEVRVQLDAASAQQVASLTNLQVTGEIQP